MGLKGPCDFRRGYVRALSICIYLDCVAEGAHCSDPAENDCHKDPGNDWQRCLDGSGDQQQCLQQPPHMSAFGHEHRLLAANSG